jgi:phage gp46-like protein
MPDIKLIPDKYGNGDCCFLPGDIETDSGLQTAVFISLFTDARDPQTEAGGYWGDSLDQSPIGSLLWTLKREKMSADLPLRIREYCITSLKWLTDQNIAKSVEVTVEKLNMYGLFIQIDIIKADGSIINQKYAYNWINQFAE